MAYQDKLADSFQQVLINLATRFINQPVERMDEAVTEALRQVVELLGGLRASINQIDEDRKEIITLYEWMPPDSRRFVPLWFPVPDADSLLPRLQRGEAIIRPNRDDLPRNSELWQLLANAGIAAAAIVPLLVKGTFTGLYISTSWDEPRDIPPEIVDLLRIVGEIFLNGMERKQNEDQIRRLNADLEARVQARTQELQAANERLQNEILERQQIEAALRVSEERYRAVTELISDYAFLYRVAPDGSGSLEWATVDSYTRVTGYVPNEALPYGLYHPDDEELARRDVEQVLLGSSVEREYRIFTKMGDMRWVYIRRYPLWDEGQQRVERFYGVAQDITRRKQVEEALRISEERYRIVSEVISDYAFLCSVTPEGAITLEWMTQDSYSRLTGYPQEDWGEAFSVYHPDDVQLASADTQRTIQGEPTEREYRIVTRSGEVRWIYLRRYPVWDEQQQRVVRFYGVAQDITERKRAEDEEREQRAVAEALLDIAEALNSTLDLDDVLDRILTNVVRIAPDDVGTVLLIEDGVARVVRARGREMPGWEEAIEGTQLPLATTPNLLHVYNTRQPLIIEDVQQYAEWVDVPASRWIRSHVCIPIQQEDEVIGFLSWEKAVPHAFAPKTVQVLQSFAHQAAIAITNARLYQQAQQLAVLQERQRLARDLHDAVTQTIFSASIISQTVPLLWEEDPDAARKGLKQLHLLTRGAVAELRSLLLELRPEALENMTLPNLMTQLADAFSGQTGIIPVLVMEGDHPLPQEVKINLYRIAQEAFNNIIKHARASEMHTTLLIHHMVKLIITDNGRGFSLQQQKSGSFGLKIMHERAEEIGANLTIESEPGIQTTISVTWDGRNV